MVANEAVTTAAEFFVQNLDTLQISSRGKLVAHFGTRPLYVQPDEGGYKALIKCAGPEKAGELSDLIKSSAHLALTRGESSVELHSEICRQLKLAGRDKSPERPDHSEDAFEDILFNDDLTTSLAELKLILIVNEKRSGFLYDPPNDAVIEYQYDFILDHLRLQLGPERTKEWLTLATVHCVTGFSPGKERLYTDESHYGVKVFNLWSEAQWRQGWVPEEVSWGALPELIREFFMAFLPDEISRYYTLAWLRDCTFERAEPILVLCGNPGTGKNILIQKIAHNLVGKGNYHSAPRGFNRTQFHGSVGLCRLFFLDETPLTAESRDILKAYHNGFETLERKFREVGKPEKIHASFALANNTESKVKLEYTDRKFWAPELSNRPLVALMGKEKVEALISLMDEPEVVRQFASYLHSNFKPQEAANFPKTVLFKRLCINSFSAAQRAFIHACQVNEVLGSRTFNKSSRRTVDPIDLRDFLALYENQFGEKLATLTLNNDLSWNAKSHIYEGPETKASAAEPTL